MVHKYINSFLILVGFLLLFGCGEKGESIFQQQATITDVKKLVEVRCSMCHFSSQIFEKQRTAKNWANIVPRMRALNRQMISAEDEQRILKYLVTNNSIPEQEE